MDPPAWDTLHHRFDTAGCWMAVATAFGLKDRPGRTASDPAVTGSPELEFGYRP
jgi:hypothetical protein